MPGHLGLPILFFLDFSLSAGAGPLLLWGLLSAFVFLSVSPLLPWDAHKGKTIGNLKQWILWKKFWGHVLHHSPWMRVCAPTSGAEKCSLCCSHTAIPGDLAVTHITEKYMDLSRQSPAKEWPCRSTQVLCLLLFPAQATESNVILRQKIYLQWLKCANYIWLFVLSHLRANPNYYFEQIPVQWKWHLMHMARQSHGLLYPTHWYSWSSPWCTVYVSSNTRTAIVTDQTVPQIRKNRDVLLSKLTLPSRKLSKAT